MFPPHVRLRKAEWLEDHFGYRWGKDPASESLAELLTNPQLLPKRKNTKWSFVLDK